MKFISEYIIYIYIYPKSINNREHYKFGSILIFIIGTISKSDNNKINHPYQNFYIQATRKSRIDENFYIYSTLL